MGDLLLWEQRITRVFSRRGRRPRRPAQYGACFAYSPRRMRTMLVPPHGPPRASAPTRKLKNAAKEGVEMDNLPKRKRMRLSCYDYSSPGAYFVTICTHEKRCILSDITVGADALGGPRVALTSVGKIVEKCVLSTDNIPGIHVDKFVIMPNHIHLILAVEAVAGPPRASAPTMAAVPNAVSALKHLVNREVGTNIWQRSYHDHVIRGENDYREIWNYIETNPARWRDDCFYTE